MGFAASWWDQPSRAGVRFGGGGSIHPRRCWWVCRGVDPFSVASACPWWAQVLPVGIPGGVGLSVVVLVGPWWGRWVRDGIGGSVMGLVGPWWDQETSVLRHGLPDPVKVVVDPAVDPWPPCLPAGVVAPGDDALQHPVAYEGSPRVTLGTKGTVTGPGPQPPDRGDTWPPGGGGVQLVLEPTVWVQPKRGGPRKTWLWGRRWLWSMGTRWRPHRDVVVGQEVAMGCRDTVVV